ncbi:MAG: class I SAM-dependent methyltransferase [Paraburkholderia sp.]|uniref:O-methyltransferase n=1 Tax=Burkholderia sp. 4M9327F10 TaxID=2502223 RepID=UPI0020171852|nr:class I SAM-dependent methyltransferase [Burkholderia sp. 4M9327F10]
MTTQMTATPSIATITTGRVKATLDRLYAETLRVDPLVRQAAQRDGFGSEADAGFYRAMRDAYMPVTPDMGNLLYLLVRSSGARSVIEYGTSFGLSTLFLAAALRDNGGGVLISTEIEAHKAAQARLNLAEAGLDDLVEIRLGDATHTLAEGCPDVIDFVLLDGAKSDYLPVLKILEPRLRTGALISADNSEMAGAQAFVDYVREPGNGYLCTSLFTRALGDYHANQIVMRG